MEDGWTCRHAAVLKSGWLFVLCTLTSLLSGQPSSESWTSGTTFYEIFVRSFKDSDGDGIGDLQGLLSQLDYLNDGDSTTSSDLGITGIWLMPVNPSPSYHGYDVTDYFSINPDYGTMDDFQDVLDACHARGIRVIMDFVGNHSSSDHPYFVQSASSAASPFRDWFVWSDQNLGTGWHGASSGWYYGLFWSGMPDWNVQHQPVVDHHYDIVDHWLAMGVDGFRYDAVKHLVNEGNVYEHHPGTFDYLEAFREHYQSVNPDAICVGEAWAGTDVIAQYGPPYLDMCFEFGLAGGIISSLNGGNGAAFKAALEDVLELHQPGAYAPFLTNHDQDRIMSVLGGDVAKAKLAVAVLMTLPGTPFIYYGEEIGMTGAGSHPAVRTPMQWAPGSQAGFTSGTPWSSAQPDVDEVNVAIQSEDPGSLLSTYREFIHLRNAETTLQRGETMTWEATSPEVAASLRTLDGDRLLVVHNFSGAEVIGPQVLPPSLCQGAYGVTDVRTGLDLGAVNLVTGAVWSLPMDLTAHGTAILRLTALNEAGDCTIPLNLSVDVHPVPTTPQEVHLLYRVNGGQEVAIPMEPHGVPNWWDVSVNVPEGASVSWRFQHGEEASGLEDVPAECGLDLGLGFLERQVAMGAIPITVPRVCFGECSECTYPPQQVTLRVDLDGQPPHPDGVHIAGDFQGWDPAATVMQPEGGGIFSHTLTIGVGETILYKFINGAAWGGLEEVDLEPCGVPNGIGGWNRQLTITPGMGILPALCFEQCAPCEAPPNHILTTFSVDMSLETEHPDGLYLEWNHPDSSWVSMDYGSNGVWTAVAQPLEGEAVEFRFRNGAEAEQLPSGCGGAPAGWRQHLVSADFVDSTVPCFSTCLPCSAQGGCTYPGAANYDAAAVFDDGSCHYVGCTDSQALNYLPVATIDDGSCIQASGVCGPGTVLDAFGLCIPDPACVEDINGDGQIGVGDILLLLSVFGAVCSP